MSEQIIDNGAASTPAQVPSIIDEITGSTGNQSTNVPGNQTNNLDEIFGNTQSNAGNAQPDGNVAPAGGPSTPSVGKPRMTPEDYLKELQSKADKAGHQLEQLKQENQDLTSVANFVNQLYEDPEVFQAFVSEINPDLVKPKSPEEYITSNLQKEFGENFIPDSSEENMRGSRTWLYNKRADALYDEALTRQSKVPETITSLKQKRVTEKKDFEVKAKQEKADIINDLNWSTSDYQGFLKWADKVSTKDFARIYQFGKNKRLQNGSPSLAAVPGGTPLSASAYETELNEFFG